jgi:hypothetical protein
MPSSNSTLNSSQNQQIAQSATNGNANVSKSLHLNQSQLNSGTLAGKIEQHPIILLLVVIICLIVIAGLVLYIKKKSKKKTR